MRRPVRTLPSRPRERAAVRGVERDPPLPRVKGRAGPRIGRVPRPLRARRVLEKQALVAGTHAQRGHVGHEPACLVRESVVVHGAAQRGARAAHRDKHREIITRDAKHPYVGRNVAHCPHLTLLFLPSSYPLIITVTRMTAFLHYADGSYIKQRCSRARFASVLPLVHRVALGCDVSRHPCAAAAVVRVIPGK